MIYLNMTRREALGNHSTIKMKSLFASYCEEYERGQKWGRRDRRIELGKERRCGRMEKHMKNSETQGKIEPEPT